MCDPVTAFMALSAGASVAQGVGAKRAADRQAAGERDAAEAEAGKIRRAGDRQRGEARAALAASGVKLGAGSAAVIEDEIVAGYEHDAMMAVLSGDRRARTARDRGRAELTGSLLAAGGAAAQGWKMSRDSRASVGWDSILSGTRGTGD